MEHPIPLQRQGVGRRDRLVLLRRTIFEPNKLYVAKCGSAMGEEY